MSESTTSLMFHKTVLDNGLTIIGEHNPQAQTFAAGYFVKTGARDETDEVAGVSHFLEHMMFKGTDKRSADDINREFDELGANYNAYTSDERTVYYGSVLPERRAGLIDLLSDMMRPALREDDFAVEKNVILEEIAMYEDRPNFKVFEEGNRRFYQQHPLGNSVLGSPDSIRNLTRDQMLRYFESRYAPDNLVLSVAGNYDWDTLVAQIAALTGSWQPQDTARRYPDADPASGHVRLENDKLKRAHVALYAPGFSVQDDNRYAASILASCLGDSSGSRLYWALVDKGLVDSAMISHDSADHAGNFFGYLSAAPEALDDVMEILEQTLQGVQDEGVSAEEWLRAQRKLATSLTLRGETPFGRLMSLGSSYQYLQEYHSVQHVIDRLMKAAPSDLDSFLATRPFDRLFSVTLTPPVTPSAS
ncbi:MAG: pitrilysin family protein [Trueperaceae bacterium]|nr:pitrilysin family protein [Trueperaceae bacterium]